METRFAATWDGWGHLGTESAAVSSTSPGHGASALLNRSLTDYCRSANGVLVDWELTLDAGQEITAGCVGLAGTNFRPGVTTWQIEASDDPAFPGPLPVDSGVVTAIDNSRPGVVPAFAAAGAPAWAPTWGIPARYYFTPQAGLRYFRVTVSDATHPHGHLRAAVPIIGSPWQPERNFHTGWSRSRDPEGAPNSQVMVRRQRLTFHRLSPDDAAYLETLFTVLKNTGRMLIDPQPTVASAAQHEVLWATIEGNLETVTVDQRGKYCSATVTFMEAYV